MRFLFTAPRYHTNQHFAVKALRDAGHEVSFLVLGRAQSEVYDAIHPTVLGKSVVMRLIGLRVPPPLSFWALMWRVKPDAVVVRNPNSAYGLLSAASAKLIGRTVIFYSQTPMHRKLGWRQRLVRSLPAWLAGAQVDNPRTRQPGNTSSRIRRTTLRPVRHGATDRPGQNALVPRWRDQSALPGKVRGAQEPPMFLRAVADLSERYPIRATVIGECTTPEHQRELADLDDLHSSLGLCGRVTFKTNLSYQDVQREYQKHDLFVLPSRDEPAAVSHLEAMSHSLPVICSDSNGTQCYISPRRKRLHLQDRRPRPLGRVHGAHHQRPRPPHGDGCQKLRASPLRALAREICPEPRIDCRT